MPRKMTLEEAMKLVPSDPMDDNFLFYSWADGPGKDYPKVTVMRREIEGAPLEPCQVWAEGWDKAFYEWVRERENTVSAQSTGQKQHSQT